MSKPEPSSPSAPAALRTEALDLREFNTFGLPARARAVLRLSNRGELATLTRQLNAQSSPCLLLGGGSNIVFTGDYDGLVIKIELKGRRLVAEDGDAWYVQAGAGENWHDFVRWTLDQGWPGLENLSLIPGTVGAAPVQNIGAYGLEMAEHFHRLEACFLHSGEMRDYDAAACRFGYRDSVFKHTRAEPVLIASVTFRLPKLWRPRLGYADVAHELSARGIHDAQPRDVSDAVIRIRQRKLPDPAVLGNAGSFFKNPLVDAAKLVRLLDAHPALPHYPQPDGTAKLAAGWLIEQCGWKGRALGAVGCYEHQALVLVNHGGATGKDVCRLARAIQDDVRTRFDIALEPEPLFV